MFLLALYTFNESCQNVKTDRRQKEDGIQKYSNWKSRYLLLLFVIHLKMLHANGTIGWVYSRRYASFIVLVVPSGIQYEFLLQWLQ